MMIMMAEHEMHEFYSRFIKKLQRRKSESI